MRFSGAVPVSAETVVRLVQAAREHEVHVSDHASTIVKAAARLWLADERASAMPATCRRDRPAVCEVRVTIADGALAVVASAAHAHGLAIEEQIRAALEAAVEAYEPMQEASRTTSSGPSGKAKNAPAAPRRPPFDPKHYARGPLPVVPAAARNVTGALMGDPGFGSPSRTGSTGRTWDV